MEVFTAIQGRRSIRKYESTPVEEEKLSKVLEAARLAPSASNLQNWKFIVVRDENNRFKLAEAAGGQSWVAQAPVVIVACGTETDKVMLSGQHRYNINVSIAVTHIILEAYELGLGTCWLGMFEEDKVKKLLNIPEDVRVVAITTLGYPSEDALPRPRKSLGEIVSFEKYI
ncbi:MAG: nitroreductase family protein [Eubacteriales bacterium]|nr:nitroreductase family protein [Eubacteriales bacterium]